MGHGQARMRGLPSDLRRGAFRPTWKRLRFTPRQIGARKIATAPLTRFFGGPPGWVLARLVLLSLILGLIFSVLDIDPLDIVDWARRFAQHVYAMGFEAVEELVRYVLLGAVIVFPVWIILRLLKLLGKGSAPRGTRQPE